MVLPAYISLLVLGITSLAAQTIFIREFLIVLSGNELTIGIILANWLLLAALGSFVGEHISLKTKIPATLYSLTQLIGSLYIPIAILVIRLLKPILGIGTGEGVSLQLVFISTLIIPSAIAFICGFQFPMAVRMLKNNARIQDSAGKAYTMESIGFVACGFIITILIASSLNSFAMAFLIYIMNAVSGTLLVKKASGEEAGSWWRTKLPYIFMTAAVLFFVLADPVHRSSVKRSLRGLEVKLYENSLYGNIVVAKNKNEATLYSNGIPILTTPSPNIGRIEDMVHFAMASHPNPKRILVIGGGPGGTLREILKYPISEAAYLEVDPKLIDAIRANPSALTKEELNDSRVSIINSDGRRYISSIGPASFDVVLVNLPPPSTLQLNRFYSRDFFLSVKKTLTDNGVIVTTLPGSLTYLSPEMRSLNGSILKTLEEVFRVNVIPGNENIFIASNNPIVITPDSVIDRLNRNHINTETFNPAYLKDRLNKNWLEWFKGSLKDISKYPVNSDLKPIAVLFTVSYWNSMFSHHFHSKFSNIVTNSLHKWQYIGIFFGILALLAIGRLKNRNFAPYYAIFSTGFVGMALNLLIIYAYQARYGYIFSHIAIMMAAFMLGIAVGGRLFKPILSVLKDSSCILPYAELDQAIFSIVIMILVPLGIPSALFFLFEVIAGSYIGLEFYAVNRIASEGSSSSGSGGVIYGLDLAGSYFAALLVSAFLLPVVGFPITCLSLALLKVYGFFISSRRLQ